RCGLDNRKQVVNLEKKLLGHVIEILFSTMIDEQAEQSRDAPWTRVWQHLPTGLSPNGLRCRGSKLQLRLRHHFVHIIDVEKKCRRLPIPGLRQRNCKIRANCSRIGSKDYDPISQQHGFLNIVGNEE